MNKLISYRADIDGLRAIAVLLVLLFHADFTWIKGGFIGVDVFFVISGYLITKSIDNEILKGSFSFQSFYLRRIRRIIPVLVFIMLVVTIPACIFLFSSDLEAYSRTVLHTALSTNNFHLWFKGKDYFVESTELIPLLHTWSLAVEEQFYFIWPIILLVLHRLFTLKNRLLFMGLFILVGIVLSVFLAHNNPKMAYFLLPARMFELSLGGGLALFWGSIPTLSKSVNTVLSSIGILLIILPSLLLDETSIFPGLNALWPCLGAVIIILSGKNSNAKGLMNKLLEFRPIVFIGLLSYSMYLWHWPIFVFIKYVGFEFTLPIKIGAITLTLVLSYFSWKLVEQPFRYKFKYSFSKTIFVILLPCLIICGLIYGVLDAKDGFPNRFPQLAEFDKAENFPDKVRRDCFDAYKVGNCEECSIGIKKDTLDGVLLGDSFANHSAPFLDVLAKDAGLYLHDSSAGGYPLLYEIDVEGKPTRDKKYAIDRLAFAMQFKSIFIASNWEKFENKNVKNYQFILKTLEELVKTDIKIFIIDPLRFTSDMNLQKMKMLKTNNLASIAKKDLLIPFYNRGDNYIVTEIKKRFPSITIIDLNEVMCNGKTCDYEIDGSIVFRDDNHLNISGAELIAKKFINKGINPLKVLTEK